MNVGLIGASRTGKTTLARSVAEATELTYVDASISKLFKEAGYNAVAPLTLDDRIDGQEKLLELYLANLKKIKGPLITDRTPIDMIGYMLGEVSMRNSTPEQGKRIMRYVERCLQATLDNFSMVIVVRPFLKYQEDPDKPPPNQAYQYHTQFIMEGAIRMIERDLHWMTLLTPDLEERIRYCINGVGEHHEALETEKRQARLH